MNWISIKDELPKGDYDSDLVDVYSQSKGRIVDCTYIDSNHWETYHGDKIDDVSHWMEQPTPPN